MIAAGYATLGTMKTDAQYLNGVPSSPNSSIDFDTLAKCNETHFKVFGENKSLRYFNSTSIY